MSGTKELKNKKTSICTLVLIGRINTKLNSNRNKYRNPGTANSIICLQCKLIDTAIFGIDLCCGFLGRILKLS
jgi:hypothetical protein